MAINQAIIEDLKARKAALLEKVTLFDQMIAMYEAESEPIAAEAPIAVPTKKRGRRPGRRPGTKASATTPAKKSGRKKISMRARIEDLLTEKASRFHSAAEIGKKLARHYADKDRDKLMRQISAMLSQMKSKGTIVSYSYGPSRKETAWGIADWLNEDGTAKEGRGYNI